QVIQHGRQQLMQPREGELHLRLHAGGTHQTAIRRSLDHVFQQRRLAYTGLTTHPQRPALPAADGIDQLLKGFVLAATAPQLYGASANEGIYGHRCATDVTRRATGTTGHWRMRACRAGLTLGSLWPQLPLSA